MIPSHSPKCSLPILVTAFVAACAPMAAHKSINEQILDSVESVPLRVGLLDRLALESEMINVTGDGSCNARRLRDAPAWMAVQGYFATVPPDTTTMYNYAELLSLEAAGKLDPETQIGIYWKRALVRGDSARVARLIKAGKVHWHYSWSEPKPKNRIIE